MVEAEPWRDVEGFTDTNTGSRTLLLQPRLLREPLQRLWRYPGNVDAVEGSQHSKRADARRGQPSHLLLADVGDATEMVSRLPPGLALLQPMTLTAIGARLGSEVRRQVGREGLEPPRCP